MGVVPLLAVLLGGFGVVALASRRRLWLERFAVFVVLGPVVAAALSWRPAGAVLLAVGVGLVGVVEYGRLARLPRPDVAVLLAGAVALPVLAWSSPGRPVLDVVVPVAAAVPILTGDLLDGGRRTATVVFGLLWICAALAALVSLGRSALPVAVAVGAADVVAFAGGALLPRWPLTPVSPGKTWGGVLAGGAAGIGVLAALGELGAATAVAVAVGGPFGDLVESLVKRQAGVKDAAGWLPGFGGLLDRMDSLLVAAPLALVLR